MTGESWTIFAPSGEAHTSFRSAAVCSIEQVSTGLTLSGVYSGSAPLTYYIEVSDASTNPNQFKWWTSATDSAKSAAVSMSTSAVTLSLGISIEFADTLGHIQGQQWQLQASGPTINITSGRNRGLDAAGLASASASEYVVRIVDGTASPNTFEY